MEPALVARGLRPAGLPPGVANVPLDLELEAGRICCLTGAQDTGKSAWLRALAAVEPPAGGELRIGGADGCPIDAASWRRLRTRTGYVSESTPLLSVLNGLTNVMLAAQYHGKGNATALRDRAFEWLEFLGWSGALDQLPAHLTRHQRCLLMLARCLLLEPAILFINEPFYLTDVEDWHRLCAVLVRIARQRGVAQLILTHDLTFVRQNADCILLTTPAGIFTYPTWSAFCASGPAAPGALRETADAVGAPGT